MYMYYELLRHFTYVHMCMEKLPISTFTWHRAKTYIFAYCIFHFYIAEDKCIQLLLFSLFFSNRYRSLIKENKYRYLYSLKQTVYFTSRNIQKKNKTTHVNKSFYFPRSPAAAYRYLSPRFATDFCGEISFRQ